MHGWYSKLGAQVWVDKVGDMGQMQIIECTPGSLNMV